MTMDEATDFFADKDIVFLTSHYSTPLYMANTFRKANNIMIRPYLWYKTKKVEDLDPNLDDFYFIITDFSGSVGDTFSPNYQKELENDDFLEITDKESKGHFYITFGDDVTEEQKKNIQLMIMRHESITDEEQREIYDYFNSNGYSSEWVDDLESNALLLKIYHVTRTSPQPAAETK